MVQRNRFELPGFSFPLNFDNEKDTWRFLSALDYEEIEFEASRLTVYGKSNDASHEFNHRKARVTSQGAYVQLNRPGGHPLMHTRFSTRKLTKWRGQLAKNGHVSPKMIDQIIKELQWKADAFLPLAPVKSDSQIDASLQQALKAAVRPLKNIPEGQKDYHPGSDDRVVDLVHPSLLVWRRLIL
ncbi:hypothetical protein N7524_006851 [Penicillium chrysogenum]|nr:hypothetical protein N7524_006851 [Penicillium chrysogenum]